MTEAARYENKELLLANNLILDGKQGDKYLTGGYRYIYIYKNFKKRNEVR